MVTCRNSSYYVLGKEVFFTGSITIVATHYISSRAHRLAASLSYSGQLFPEHPKDPFRSSLNFGLLLLWSEIIPGVFVWLQLFGELVPLTRDSNPS